MIRRSLRGLIDRFPSSVQRLLRTGRAFLLHNRGIVMPSRFYLAHLLGALGLTGEGAEIGVAEGKFSETLLRASRLSRLYSIDPWFEFPATAYTDRNNLSQREQDARYERVVARLGAFGSRSVIWRTTSIAAAGRIADGTLDFVFIDANHDHDSVAADIAAWWPKVRPGGVFGGHDYLDEIRPGYGTFGVKRAVDAFMRGRHERLFVTAERWPSWYLVRSGAYPSP
jgi:hypothetical protein